MLLISWTIDNFVTTSEGNSREHWHKSAKRHNLQKDQVNIYLKDLKIYKYEYITIKLVRISPRKLDIHDNLPMAFKYVVDAIADLMYPGKAAERADNTDLIEWKFDQEKGKPKQTGMRVEVYER